MGCLNSDGKFSHWFGNIHLSGPCNRSCYFCIGQHMQSLETYDVLGKWPLTGFGAFVDQCRARGVREVNITGSNTDPLLYLPLPLLVDALHEHGFTVGVRTNAADKSRLYALEWFDRVSVSVHSFDRKIYRAIMGNGTPPDIERLAAKVRDLKLNVVLCPENTVGGWPRADVYRTLDWASARGVRRINLREPYGQPHVGDPLVGYCERSGSTHGMPAYEWDGATVTYWDVHYVEVESVNLYANGTVSETYPITKGYDTREGKVLDQSHWREAKRHLPQWPSATP